MSESFIVRLKESATDSDVEKAYKDFEAEGGTITHKHTLFKGFSGSLPSDKVTALETLPHVEAVEKDQKVNVL